MTDSSQPAADKESMGQAAQQAGEHLHEAGQQATQGVGEAGGAAVRAVQEQVERLRQSAGECLHHGRERLESMEQTLEDQIRDRPLRAVLMAAGAGFLFGMLWRRRD